MEDQKERKNKKKDKEQAETSVGGVIGRENAKMLLGLAVFVISLIALFSCGSFLFVGHLDQSIVEHLDLATNEEVKAEVHNLCGYLGAKFSNFLIAGTFGVPVVLMIYFFIRLGLSLMNFGKNNLLRLFGICVFFTLWLSFLFSVCGFETSFYNLGGQCGKMEDILVEAQTGIFGAVMLLIFTFAIYLLVSYPKEVLLERWNWLKEKLSKGKFSIKGKEAATDIVEEKPVMNGEVSSQQSAVKNEPEENDAQSVEPSAIKTEEEKINNTGEEEQVEAKETQKPETDKADEIVFDVTVATETEKATQKENGEENEPVAKEIVQSVEPERGDSDYDPLKELGPYDPTLDLSDYKMPTLDLLKEYATDGAGYDREEQEENYRKIKEVLGDFNINITEVKGTVGPTIALYEISLARGIKISRVTSLADDIALRMKANGGVRIIAPIPGKGTVGIEIPNKKPQIVSMRSILDTRTFQDCKYELPIALGKTITNSVFMVDLAKQPHLLVAGATGQGKSVGLNALIASLLYKKHPSQLKFVMVDPKMVEFSIYSTIEKHFLAKLPGEEDAIITDTTKVVQTLVSLTTEMDNRYKLLMKAHCRNIIEYNNKFVSRRLNPEAEVEGTGLCHHYMPYIVVIIDEYGDLMMTAGKEVEAPIARIAQKARAVGIHMVLATQRPSVQIVTGTIKANFPARMAFRVASGIDSKTILDQTGAQNLVGRGDMLYLEGSKLTRVQCAFLDTPEVENINTFIGGQQGYPEAFMLPEYVDENGDVVGSPTVNAKELDPLLRQAAELVIRSQNGSTSSLQRVMSLGFNRAGRIMDQLEAIGVVGAQVGSKPRSVLVSSEQELDTIFLNLKK